MFVGLFSCTNSIRKQYWQGVTASQMPNATTIGFGVKQKQIYSKIWTNTIVNLNKYNCQFRQIQYGGFSNLLIAFLQIFSQSKYILKFEQIQLSIWTNTIISLDKYNYQFRQIQCGGFGQLYWLYFCKTSPKANKNNVTPKHCWNICRALQCIVCQHYQFLKHHHRRNAINHHLFDYFNFFRFDH